MRKSLKCVTVVVTSDGYTLPAGYSVKTVLSSSGVVVRYEETGGVVRFSGVDEGTKVVVYMSKADSGEGGEEPGFDTKVDMVCTCADKDMVLDYGKRAYETGGGEGKYKFATCTNAAELKGKEFADVRITSEAMDYNYMSLSDVSGSRTEFGQDGLFYIDRASMASHISGVWKQKLPSIENGRYMFRSSAITSFPYDLPALKNGYYMFRDCTSLTSFTGDMPSLTNGSYMFSYCTSLPSFTGDLSSLTNGQYMFYGCSKLTSFTGDLSSLTDGQNMFAKCKLDVESVERIANSLPVVSSAKEITIGTGVTTLTQGLVNSISTLSSKNWYGVRLYNVTGEVNQDLSFLSNGYYMFSDCTSLTSFTGDLSSLTNGRYMFSDCTSLTSWNVDLPALTDGYYMFENCTSLTSFTGDLSALTSSYQMFYCCSKLTSWNIELPKLTSGGDMFRKCSNLTSFTVDLSALESGTGMFNGCSKLTSFNSDLSALNNGGDMFNGCTSLTSWTVDLPALDKGNYMFENCSNLTSFTVDLSALESGTYMFNGCTSLTSFNSDLSKLTSGSSMFNGCTSLTSFTVDLSALESGRYMFDGCKLDKPSVLRILNSIPAGGSYKTITIGSSLTETEITSDTEVKAAIKKANGNGWTVSIDGKSYKPS